MDDVEKMLNAIALRMSAITNLHGMVDLTNAMEIVRQEIREKTAYVMGACICPDKAWKTSGNLHVSECSWYALPGHMTPLNKNLSDLLSEPAKATADDGPVVDLVVISTVGGPMTKLQKLWAAKNYLEERIVEEQTDTSRNVVHAASYQGVVMSHSYCGMIGRHLIMAHDWKSINCKDCQDAIMREI